MPTEPTPERLKGLSLAPRGRVHPSPRDWRDQIFYFLLPDRFSDGAEAGRPRFDRGDPEAFRAEPRAWMEAGKRFQGGTLRGIESKLAYLEDLGVTTLWVGPVFKQRKDLETYHGYGIQDFLDVDPRFGTRDDLRRLIDAAHARDMYVLLDIIYNHTGNNWFYAQNGAAVSSVGYRPGPAHALFRWRASDGAPRERIVDRDDGVWPREFQDEAFYTRAGSIGRWDPQPGEAALDPRSEFRRGDFFDLKDLRTQEAAPFQRDPEAERVLAALVAVYQYWIATSDCDGFRVDTVKHISFEASRNFCGAIHEYAEMIGKESFLLLGEVTGGAGMARDYLDVFGRNLDAAIDLGAPAGVLASLVKGQGDPRAFFAQFGGHDALGTHREVGRYHLSVLDDHDMVGRTPKARFSAGNTIAHRHAQVAHAVGVQLTTLGMPCIYYGTEQAFDGAESRHDAGIEPRSADGSVPFSDRYIRESMFGGSFGAFATAGCHFFDASHPTYRRIAAIARVVRGSDLTGKALRRGRQYARAVKVLGGFEPPTQGEIVAWSRVFFDHEVVVVLNTHGTEPRGGWVSVDAKLRPPGTRLSVRYRSSWSDAQLAQPPAESVDVVDDGGRAVVRIDLPAAGMMLLA